MRLIHVPKMPVDGENSRRYLWRLGDKRNCQPSPAHHQKSPDYFSC